MGKRYTPFDMIAALVSFDTVSRHSNLDLIRFIEDYLDGWGVPHQRIENDLGTKANLLATLGPADMAGGIVLSGHTDVVPVDGQDWSADPFTLRQADGKLFGRGTCDMKSFFAIALALVPDFLERGLRIPVHFALSYDEEIGCLGVRPLIDQAIRQLPKPEVVIVGEPSDMMVVNAHKSINAFKTHVRGLEAHSSATNEGVNAVMIAAELIHFISGIGEEMKVKGDPSGRFTPPYTSVHVGPIEGGTALNIIPKDCAFEWEFRSLPDQDAAEIVDRVTAYAETVLLPKMHAVSANTWIRTKAGAHVPSLVPDHGTSGEALVLKLAAQNETHAVSYGTEAGLFQLADIPTVICGPGSILQAHKPDEFVTLAQVATCERFMRRLMDHVAL
ncbi:MAG: acetylornithine deacetylase [Parvibaculum sp.]